MAENPVRVKLPQQQINDKFLELGIAKWLYQNYNRRSFDAESLNTKASDSSHVPSVQQVGKWNDWKGVEYISEPDPTTGAVEVMGRFYFRKNIHGEDDPRVEKFVAQDGTVYELDNTSWMLTESRS